MKHTYYSVSDMIKIQGKLNQFGMYSQNMKRRHYNTRKCVSHLFVSKECCENTTKTFIFCTKLFLPTNENIINMIFCRGFYATHWLHVVLKNVPSQHPASFLLGGPQMWSEEVTFSKNISQVNNICSKVERCIFGKVTLFKDPDLFGYFLL